jgi:hypothetical protein
MKMDYIGEREELRVLVLTLGFMTDEEILNMSAEEIQARHDETLKWMQI